jgi:hypothetical protein
MFFTDSVNSPLYNDPNAPQVLRIDFGDNTGWHYFDMNMVSHYSAFPYAMSGSHQIIVEVYLPWRGTIKRSVTNFFTTTSAQIQNADEYLDFPGMTVGAYYPCKDLPFEEQKVIIYLEGFDLFDLIPSMANTIEMNYHKMISSKYIEELLNFNYAFYVLNYDNSRLDLRINAMHTLNVIEYLKNKYAYNNEQFVFIGHSMGGVIGRFLLTYMESEAYQNGDFSPLMTELDDPQNWLYLLNLELNGMSFSEIGKMNRNDEMVGQMHNIRTFITLDSPHQGASIPLGMQQLYRKAFLLLPVSATLASNALNFMLDSKAAKQLLIEHIDATPLAILPNSNIHYSSHPKRLAFMNQLEEMGDYPKFCKKIAYTSADMGGSNLRTHWDDDILRWANDPIANIDVTLRARVLFVTRDIADIKLRINTNPNGSGEIFHASLSKCFYTPQIYWFGISMNQQCFTLLSTTDYAINTKAYNTSASGYYDVGINLTPAGGGSQCISQNNNIFNLFVIGSSATSTICSNGTYFGFVPLQSALDYGKDLNLPLNHNIQAENINTKLSRTPFDVIIGYTDGHNHNHSNEYYDPLIYNLTGQPAGSCQYIEDMIGDPYLATNYKYAYHDANLQGECEMKRSLLCLEIGDEEMYLENLPLNRTAQFSAQYNMFVNERNPYYEYPSSSNNAAAQYNGLYSKQAPFQVVSNGWAHFLYNENSPSSNGGFVYNNDVNESGLWSEESREMKICVNDYAQGKNQEVAPVTALEEAQIHMHLYPNPNNGEVMMLEYDFLDDSQVQLEVYDVSGKKVAGLSDLAGGENRIRLHLNKLENGLYLVRVFTATQSQTVRLIIN